MKTIPTQTAPLKPEGSAFYVDSCPFNPGGNIDPSLLAIDEAKLYDWPMVYILANQEQAYVGQTTSVVRRMSQHGANPEKRAFQTANVIYNAETNMSVITDYESRLIQLMSADGKFQLTNKNEGIADSDYFSKAEYDLMFEDLWAELRNMELADHTIAELEESEVFKYSPYKSLNDDQRAAAREILNAIEAAAKDRHKGGSIVVEGMPGTGKTVLAVYLLKFLKDNPKFAGMNIRILEPVPPLLTSMRSSLKGVMNLSKDDVIGPADLAKPRYTGGAKGKPFDILLVDESHRLKQYKNIVARKSFKDVSSALGFADVDSTTQLDWVLKQARVPVLFYDPMQVVGPSGIGADIMRNRLGSAFENPIRLQSQMRVKGGKRYLDYVEDILWDRRPGPQAFEGYDLTLHEDFREFHDSFLLRLGQNSLTRMVAGFAWPWASKKDGSATDIQIDGIKIRWNSTISNWVGKGVEHPEVAREMGVIHTIQGYDLSYAYVVIGPDLRYDEAEGRIVVDRDNYFDKNGKQGATDAELEEYVKHVYYVLLTRGIQGTHVYVCDPALRRHLAGFMA
jgi:DUF2075 family protein/predicted GIY-YIG superfamily endonuclease